MKIAFLYSYRENEIWSTPLSLAVEFQSRGWEVEIFSTLSSEGNYTDAGIKLMFDKIKGGYKPDIIFYLDWGRFDSSLLNKDLYPSAYWVTEMGDEIQNYDRNFPRSDRFHICLSPDHRAVTQYKDAGRNAIFFTHWADTCVQHPMNIAPIYDAVCTRGPGSSQILDHLQYDLGDRFCNQNGYIGLCHSEALQKGKIVVQHSRYGEITRRIFEAMACGRMVLTDRLHDTTQLGTLFTDKVDIVYYDNYKDCLSKIEYYTHNDKEREQIAFSGRGKVIRHHTQYQRVDSILKQFRIWKSNQ